MIFLNYIIADHIESLMLINGYGNYEVSSIGRVRNNRSGRMLQCCYARDCYLKVNLCKKGKQKNQRVHRLVAEAFCKNSDGKHQVDHIDNNRMNNHYTNLRWTTGSENCRNKQITSKNTSGYKGIWFDKLHCKWIA